MTYPNTREGSISIHTPARGVTISALEDADHYDISIHTPARGVTSSKSIFTSSKTYFNPHSRKGSDIISVIYPVSDKISIHTPARGVTAWPALI